jgi:predicted Zn-ribbon and HTH transcriptional regulator
VAFDDTLFNGEESNGVGAGGNSKEVKQVLKELDSGIHDKVSLIKMLIIKCSDADSNFKKIKKALAQGEYSTADKIVTQLEQLNLVTLKDLQTEVQQKSDLLDQVAALADLIKKERQELVSSKSVGKGVRYDDQQQEIKELKRCIEEQRLRIRELEQGKSSRKEQVNRNLMEQLNDADS